MPVARLCLHVLLLWLAVLPVRAAETLPRPPGTDFRVLVWNVSRERFFEQADGYEQVLRSVDAELLILDEMPADRRASDVHDQLQRVAPGQSWQVYYGSSGDRQRSVFAVRGGRLDPLPEFRALPYPPDFSSWLFAQLPAALHGKARASLDAGVAAAGVALWLGGRELLAVGIDLQCCGDRDDAWEERRREVELQLIRQALDHAWQRRRPAAVLLGGDFNAVRGLRQVKALALGPAARQLRAAPARHGNGQDDWTWDGRGTRFPSRPLDFLLHSDALVVRQALVFDSETLPDPLRQRLGLPAALMRGLSEHRPLVVDLAWRRE